MLKLEVYVLWSNLVSNGALPPSLPLLRGEIGNKCLGTPFGYSDVSGKRRAPWVDANMIDIYSGSLQLVGDPLLWADDDLFVFGILSLFFFVYQTLRLQLQILNVIAYAHNGVISRLSVYSIVNRNPL